MTAKSVTRDMTYGSPLKLIVGFALPMILGNLFQQMYSMVDTIIVGRYLGVGALAAVGSVGSLQFMILGFCLGSCVGLSIPIAQQFGAKDIENLHRYVANGIYLASLMAVLVTAVTLLLSHHILRWMQTPQDIIADAYSYFSVILLGIPAMILYNMASAIMRALGDSRRPLYFLILSSGINIVLDLVFILWFHWGCAGAAWATILSQLISGVLCVVYMIQKLPILRLEKEEWKVSAPHLKNLSAMGFPMGLQNSITAIGSVLLSSAVNSLGSTAVASMTAGFKVQMIFNSAYDAMGNTMATYCGQNLGARKLSRIGRGLRCGIWIMIGYTALSFAFMYFFGTTVALLFVSPTETEILANVHIFLVITAASSVLLVFVNLLRYAIQGLGFSRYALFAGLFEMVARSSVAFLLVPAIGFTGACFASPAAWVAADCFLVPCYLMLMRRIRRTTQEVPDLPEESQSPATE